MQRSPWVDRSSPSEPHRSLPTRRSWAGIGCAVALTTALAACGSSGSSSGTTTTAVLLSSAQLTEALLAVGDLPRGWSVDESTTATTDLNFGMLGSEDFNLLCPDGVEALRTETHETSGVRFR